MKPDGNKLQAGLFANNLRTWGLLWRVPALGSLVTVESNWRLRTTIARYVLRTRTIELGPGFFRLRKRRLAVLCHEAAHAAVAFKFGPAEQPHGPIWASLVEAAGYSARRVWVVPRRRVTCNSRDGRKPRSQLVYEHRCPVCQSWRLARRPVRTWRCAECSAANLTGVLTIVHREICKEGM